jgi:4-diphosphocytidyl-2-C-methyl-D-erythritol kinase
MNAGTALTLRAPAKVNLRLSVLAREMSGYHQIETVFHALDLADELTATAADGDIQLTVDGHDAGPVADNLVMRAARLFQEASGETIGVQFRLAKRIPAGAGLGGGSSDAAAALLAMNTLCREPLAPDALIALAATIGSDVPFFLCGSPHALAWGRGNRLLTLPPLPSRPVLVVAPPFASPTAEAYRRLAETPPPPAPARTWSYPALVHWDDVAAAAVNDFEPVFLPDHPPLQAALDALHSAGAAPALLAGSGSALFGVFRDEATRKDAARHMARTWPELRLIQTRTAEGATNTPG